MGKNINETRMVITEKGLTKQIIDYVLAFNYDDVPTNVMEHTKIIILDTLGAMIAASNPRYPASRILTDFVREQGGREDSTIIGRDFKTSSTNAALINGTMGYMCDIESHHVKSMLHEAAVILPSALAVGEKEKVSGRDIITAFVLGCDLDTRVCLAISATGMYLRGFHPTVVAGCFGSAMTAGKVLNLNRDALVNAFGLAGHQASTLLSWESDKTEMSRPFGPGVAARNGVTAALLAQKGFGGPEVLEGKYNVFHAFSGEAHYNELFEELGSRFEVMNLSIKQYSSCSFTHPGLDALLSMMDEHNIIADDVDEVNVRFPTGGAKLVDRSELKSHNIQYVLSVGAYNKQVIIDDILFDQEDERIWDLYKRTNLIYDDELDKVFPTIYPTIIEIKTKDGKIFENRVDWARGTPENPMTYDEIRKKYIRIATLTIDEERAKNIMNQVDKLEKLNDINELTKMLMFKQ